MMDCLKNMKSRIKVLTFHQMDPLGTKIGGTETFVKDFIKYAPEDFDIEFVGITSNKGERTIGRWHEVKLYDKKFRFMPTMFVHNENLRTIIPLTLKFTFSIFKHRHKISLENRILEFHRIEPSFPCRNMRGKKVLFLHGHMADLYNPLAEARWAKFPGLYFYLEKRQINQFKKIFIVREDGVKFYQKRYPALKKRISFIPTWVDVEMFHPYTEAEREKARSRFIKEKAFSTHDKLILFAGRLESQKDPLLLIDTFFYVQKMIPNARLVMAGTGVMKNRIEQKNREYDLSRYVRLLGAVPQSEIAELMRISDVFLLTSAFEGMPRSVLEALACGLPVVSPDVGEVRRVVKNGVSGIICTQRSPEMLGDVVITVLSSNTFLPDNCARAIQDYTATRILGDIYQFYYQLSGAK